MSFFKNAILILGDLIGLNWLFRRFNAGKVRVLMYHGVTTRVPETYCWTVLPTGEFAWQMKYLRRNYNVRPASEVLADRPQHKDPAGGVTVITFDDGLDNNYSEAWPILSELGLKAICFVLPGLSQRGEQIWADDLFEFFVNHPAGEIDLKEFDLGSLNLSEEKEQRAGVIGRTLETIKDWPAQKRDELLEHLMPDRNTSGSHRSGVFKLMTIDQINQLAASREFEIGIHTDTHPIMSGLSLEQQEQEISGAIDNLRLGEIRYVPIFAYPNGRSQDYNRDTIAALKKSKLRAAVTTVDTLWEDDGERFHIPRIGIGADTSRWEFKARMSGLFYFLAALGGRN